MKEKKIIITQPTFLPYSGYFAALSICDEVIFLDDIQFSKRGWQQRNVIKTKNNKKFITVPVKSKNLFNQKISEVQIDKSDAKWKKKILGLIQENYKNSKYFSNYYSKIKQIIEKDRDSLMSLNLELINLILNFFEIKLNILMSSELKNKKNKFELIEEIYFKQKATNLLTTVGVKDYFPKIIEKMNVTYYIYNDKIKTYNQQYEGFESNLSVIDLLFNCGHNSKEFFKKNLLLKNDI